MIELKYFRLIVSISEEESLTKAAEKLCLTQSALSHQLKELKEFLGFAVFHRLNHKLIPTAHEIISCRPVGYFLNVSLTR